MDQELKQLVDAGKLTTQEAETLESLAPGTACLHKSWGFGRVSDRSPLLNQITIDFRQKRGHAMQLSYAAQTLQSLPGTHVLARIDDDADALRTQARTDPAAFVRGILADNGGAATQDQIASLLAHGLFTQEEFKKWWATARKHLAKDTHIELPTKKTDPIRLRDEPLSRAEELLATFSNARSLKDQVAAIDAITREQSAFADHGAALQQLIETATDIASRNQKLHPSLALEILICRDELRAAANLSHPPEDALTTPRLLASAAEKLPTLLSGISAQKLKLAIASLPEAFGEEWVDRALRLFLHAPGRIVGESAKLLAGKGKQDVLDVALDRAVRERSATADLLIWLCKTRAAEFERLATPALFAAILAVMEREQMNDSRKGGRLSDLLFDDQKLISDMLANAPQEEVREITRRMLSTTVFEELSKRSLMARIIKAHPEMQSMLSGDSGEKAEALVVSWQSLERRKNEYEEVITKKIPENRSEISVARSYGDLRENFEYKAAKEMQSVLMRRKAELEQMLDRARGTAFEDPDTTQISIGTVSTVEEIPGGERIDYILLGAWDSDPDRHVISYQTAIGQALLGKRPGEEVDLTTDHGPRRVRVLKIRAFKSGEDYVL